MIRDAIDAVSNGARAARNDFLHANTIGRIQDTPFSKLAYPGKHHEEKFALTVQPITYGSPERQAQIRIVSVATLSVAREDVRFL